MKVRLSALMTGTIRMLRSCLMTSRFDYRMCRACMKIAKRWPMISR